MKDLFLRCSEDALACRAEASFCGRPRLLRNFEPRQQRFEVAALKFLSAIKHKDLGEACVPAYALTNNHHARAITWRIERDVERQNPAGKRIGQQRNPG